MQNTPPSIVAVGSLHYDIMVNADRQPEKGETLMGSHWSPKFGGKGGNQAVAAHLTGSDVRFIGAIGYDDFGTFLRTHLEQVGVNSDHLVICNTAGSGMSVAIADADGDYAAVVVSGANARLQPEDVSDASLWAGGSVLILQNEIPEEVNVAAAVAARAAGLKVVWNAAPMRPDNENLISLCDVVILNSVEARQMTGKLVDNASDALIAAKTVADTGTATVVTIGGDGLAFCEIGGTAQHIPAIPVEKPQSHGAGDVFTGALSTALASGVSLGIACERATRAAYLHVSGKKLELIAY
ncbi:ribokinase [Cohaesibacter celericrescens]|uniref:Ribokinase n=1 Tax=Cohaesibacter celericrescens TaxID=2067669 RepID=A0A2N5XQB0_9HYPH|nr:ribokinase [Cohaesibacter celericrescens]PLW76630.1 ribokinase [Cohaesibacter celericrescens]